MIRKNVSFLNIVFFASLSLSMYQPMMVAGDGNNADGALVPVGGGNGGPAVRGVASDFDVDGDDEDGEKFDDILDDHRRQKSEQECKRSEDEREALRRQFREEIDKNVLDNQAREAQEEALRKMLKHDPSLFHNCSDDVDVLPAAFRAIQNNRPHALDSLLRLKADINSTYSYAGSDVGLLEYAVILGHDLILTDLLERQSPKASLNRAWVTYSNRGMQAAWFYLKRTFHAPGVYWSASSAGSDNAIRRAKAKKDKKALELFRSHGFVIPTD